MSDPQDKVVRIVVAGHTNVGKTTLIRTLIKAAIGVVADRANVTQVSEEHRYEELEYNGMQAIFVDTPGFQVAGELLRILQSRERDPDYEIPDDIDPAELKYDELALESIRNSDVVL